MNLLGVGASSLVEPIPKECCPLMGPDEGLLQPRISLILWGVGVRGGVPYT